MSALPSVLVVESSSFLLETLGELLEICDYTPILATNGFEGIQLANVYPPDIILTEQNMPVMCGSDMSQMLRRDPRFAHTPIFILTALNTGAEFRDEMHLMGVDTIINKPYDVENLLQKMSEGLGFPPRLPFSRNCALLLHDTYLCDYVPQVCAALASRIQTPLIVLPSRLDADEAQARNKSLSEALRASRTLTVFVTQNALGRNYVQRATDFFAEHRKPMAAIMLEDCTLPDAFADCHAFDMHELELYVDWLRRNHPSAMEGNS
jgi:two-component system, chemotaxis family, chemotaxis protein CheY